MSTPTRRRLPSSFNKPPLYRRRSSHHTESDMYVSDSIIISDSEDEPGTNVVNSPSDTFSDDDGNDSDNSLDPQEAFHAYINAHQNIPVSADEDGNDADVLMVMPTIDLNPGPASVAAGGSSPVPELLSAGLSAAASNPIVTSTPAPAEYGSEADPSMAPDGNIVNLPSAAAPSAHDASPTVDGLSVSVDSAPGMDQSTTAPTTTNPTAMAPGANKAPDLEVGTIQATSMATVAAPAADTVPGSSPLPSQFQDGDDGFGDEYETGDEDCVQNQLGLLPTPMRRQGLYYPGMPLDANYDFMRDLDDDHMTTTDTTDLGSEVEEELSGSTSSSEDERDTSNMSSAVSSDGGSDGNNDTRQTTSKKNQAVQTESLRNGGLDRAEVNMVNTVHGNGNVAINLHLGSGWLGNPSICFNVNSTKRKRDEEQGAKRRTKQRKML